MTFRSDEKNRKRKLLQKARKYRRLSAEQLEERNLLNADWQNPVRPNDVNNDMQVSAIDALIVINEIGRNGFRTLEARTNRLDRYLDTNADGRVSPIDPLRVINQIAREGNKGIVIEPRVEGASEPTPAGFISTLFAQLPDDGFDAFKLSSQINVMREEFNEMGLFIVDGPGGTVNGIAPSSTQYPDAVFAQPERRVLYSRRDLPRDSRDIVMPSDTWVGVYVLQGYSSDGTPDAHLRIEQLDASSFQIGWQKRAVDTSGSDVDSAFNDVLIDVQLIELDIRPPELSLRLVNDTGRDPSDGVTLDAQISARVSDDVGIQSLRVGFGETSVDQYVELSSSLNAQGELVLTRIHLESILGESLIDGTYTLHAIATDSTGNMTATDVVFTLDTVAPTPPTASLSATSQSNEEDTTAFARVSLVGQAAPNDLISITGTSFQGLASNIGRYQIPGVALELGNNLLSLLAEDAAGNTSAPVEVSIHRLEPSPSVDPILKWNEAVLEAIRLDASTPPFASRAMAMVHAAIFDTVNAMEGKPGFFVSMDAESLVATEVAVAAAGHGVLTYLYPAYSELFDSTLESTLAGVDDGPAKDNGIALGEEAAFAIIKLRSDDGWDDFVDYIPSTGLGDWQPTLPMFDIGLLPQWAYLTPFTLNSPDQFRPGGPPDLASAAFADAFKEVKELGRSDSTTRTADQSEIAQFWVNGLGTYTPPGHWNQIAMRVAAAEGNSLSENARLFAQLNFALADASIAAWDAKYFYDYWRPITAIQHADSDGNNVTTSDPAWIPFMTTPPFPEYVSGHSAFSGAAAAVLTANFGDNYVFETSSIGLPGVTREFNSFNEAGEEAGRSRVYGGIHYEFSNQDGLETGRAVAQHVIDSFSVQSDALAPTLTLDTTEALVVSENVSITGAVLDTVSGVQSVEVSLNGEAFSTLAFDQQGRFDFGTTFALDGSDDGQHVFRVRASDFAGNVTEDHVITVVLDTADPQLLIDSPSADTVVSAGDRLTGTIDGTGSVLRSLRYAIDDGDPIPLATDGGNAFDVLIDVWALSAGPHELVVTGIDSAGNLVSESRSFRIDVQPELMISAISPGNGAVEVGTTFRPQVFFSRSIDPKSINENNFFATGPSGERIAAQIVPANDGKFAWLFFDSPLPGGATITLQVGNEDIVDTIRTPEGGSLDANQNGEQGGVFRWQFTTVSLSPLPGTNLTGIVADPGPDRKPGTLDDVRSGADGVLGTADDVYLRPIAGAHVYVIGLEEFDVITDENGRFTLDAVPAGNVKLVIDGMTATDAPSEVYFPEMVMDLNILGGRTNTVMAAMEPVPARRAETEMHGVYLPRIETSILETVLANEEKTIGVDAKAAPNLTAEQRAMLTLEIQPNSLVGSDGTMLDSGEIGISTVPPELVRDMLPPGLLQHTFDITIQAPGISNFSTPMPMTFPNTMGAAPGTKLNFLSFDHTTGRLVIEGTATVSPDGKSVRTDPGTGITHPGWHGLTPPGGCGASGGNPPPPPPTGTPTINAPVLLPLITDESGTFPLDSAWLTWGTKDLTNDPAAPPPPPGCEPRSRDDSRKESLTVKIEIDGPLEEFMKKPDANFLPLSSQSFTITADSKDTKEFKFGAEALKWKDMFTSFFGLLGSGIDGLETNILYGSKITVTETTVSSGGTTQTEITPYYLYRFIDATDDRHDDGTISFEETVATDGIVRQKLLTLETGIDSEPKVLEKNGGDFISLNRSDPIRLNFYPSALGERTDSLEITTPDGEVLPGEIKLKGVGRPVQEIVLDEQGLAAALSEFSANFDAHMEDYATGCFANQECRNRYVQNHPGTEETVAGIKSSLSSRLKADFQSLLSNESANSLANSISERVRSLYSAFEVTFSTGAAQSSPNAVTLNYSAKGPEYDYEGLALIDIETSRVRDYLKNHENYSTSRQGFELDQLSNRNLNGIAYVFLTPHVVSNFQNGRTAFVNQLSRTIAHEVGHTLSLVHPYDFEWRLREHIHPDIMSYALDEDGTRTFHENYSSMPLRIALNGDWTERDVRGTSTNLLRAIRNQTIDLGDGQSGFSMMNGDDNGWYLGVDLPLGPFAFWSLDSIQVLNAGRFDFGETLVGQTTTANLNVTNLGTETLVIEKLISNGDSVFFLDELSDAIEVETGESYDFQLTFSPLDAGPVATSLVINTNQTSDPKTFTLTGYGRPIGPAIAFATVDNNFGGIRNDRTTTLKKGVVVVNDGSEQLTISGIRVPNSDTRLRLVGVPENLDANPVVLNTDEQFSFEVEFTPESVGLQSAAIEIESNDPLLPILEHSLVSTGLDDVIYPAWGNDFVAIEFPELPGDRVLRTVSDPSGDFEFFLPPTTPYHLTIFDPLTGLVSHGYGMTPVSGAGTDLTATLVFDASIAPDTDFDGLPDDIEFAIGTSSNSNDTDRDGLTDFAEIQQGLDPLTGLNVQTGIIASLMLPGESRQVVVVGDSESPTTQHAFVATGSHGLAIVDVSQFDNPVLLGQIELDGIATDVAVDTGRAIAAVATNSGGIHVIDVSDRIRPRLSRVIPGNFSHVAIVDGLVYGVEGKFLFAYDLQSGYPLSSIGVSAEITDITWDGKMLYSMETTRRLTVVDISSGELNLRGNVTLPDGGGSISSANGIIYAAAANRQSGGFATADVSDPDNPFVLSGRDDSPEGLPKSAVIPNGSGLALLIGQAEGVIGRPSSFTVMDVSNPENTANFLTRINLDLPPTSVSIAGGIGLITDASGLRVINYLAFDAQGEPPTLNVSLDAGVIDMDTETPGIQVLEGFSVPVEVAIYDDVQVRSVELLIDGQVVQTAVSFPFHLTAIAPVLPDGSEEREFTIQVRATDTGSNTAISAPITLHARQDLSAPTVERFEVSLPDEDSETPGSQLLRDVRLVARFASTDLGSLQSIELLRNGDVIAVQSRPSGVFEITTVPLANEETFRDVELRLRATDRAGNIAFSDPIAYRVVPDTFPPTIAEINLEEGNVKGLGTFSLIVDFSEPMDATTLTASAFSLAGPEGVLEPEEVTVAVDDQRVQVRYTLLQVGEYTLSVDAPNVTDRVGNALGINPILINFEAEDTTGPLYLGQQFPAGDNPQKLTTGDFNGDGYLDLAVPNYGWANQDGYLSVLLGNGHGTFGAEERFAVAPGASSVATADFNRDGIADLAVSSRSADNVSVLLGIGDGTFRERLYFDAGDSPSRVATGDFNGDGFSDMVVANWDSDDVSMLLGNGDGTFADQQRFAAGDAPSSVATGDFNDDGITDLAVTNRYSDDISVLRGIGDGTFASHIRFAVGDSPADLTTGDFNGDGITDVGVANRDSKNVSVLLGIGNGTFGTQQRFPVPGNNSGPSSITTGDFNGDGVTDLAVANTGDGDTTGSVLLGVGEGTFTNAVRFTAGSSPQSVTSADFNNDGVTDLVVANRLGLDVSVLLGNGDGTFMQTERFAVGNGPRAMTIADFNSDGFPDLAVANLKSNDVSVLLGNGDGSLASQQRLPVGYSPKSLAIGDFNGDGIIDLVTANGGPYSHNPRGSISVLLGNGDGTFAPQNQTTDGSPKFVTSDDFNSDGISDLVILAWNASSTVSVLAGNGDGTFTPLQQINVDSPTSVTTGDFDGDGTIDLAFATYLPLGDVKPWKQNGTVLVVSGNGDGTFDTQSRFETGIDPSSLTTGDFNDDGVLDLAVANTYSDDVSVLLGIGGGSFADQTRFTVGDGPSSVVSDDLNNDGILDLAVANSNSRDDVSVLLGNGDGTFSAELRFAAGDSPVTVATGDFDSNGFIDLIVANYLGNDVSVLLNQRSRGDGS